MTREERATLVAAARVTAKEMAHFADLVENGADVGEIDNFLAGMEEKFIAMDTALEAVVNDPAPLIGDIGHEG